MPFTFLAIGTLLIVAGVRGTDEKLWTLLKGDFQNSPSFLPWVVSILLIGALGYISSLKTFSRAFLTLVIVVLFLSNGGFFQRFQQAVPEAFGGAKKQ